MKNRKTVVVAFLLVAVMLLGVGFAELTDVLEIQGELGAVTEVAQNDFDADVYFSGTAVDTDETGNQAASQILEGRDSAKITAKHFSTKGQKVVVKYTIKNDSTDFAARITPNTLALNQTGEHAGEHDAVFTAVWSWEKGAENKEAIDLQPGATKDLYVTITLIETPTEAHSAEFTVTYNVVAVDPATNITA